MNILGIVKAIAPDFVLQVAIFTFVLLVIGIGLTCYEFHKDAKHFEKMKRSRRKKS
ncbi:MAG: hypothetical protein P1U39_06330 [Legionellaceae bacterium]|nr:hypothetical protein [Legionellaceae bacterium]